MKSALSTCVTGIVLLLAAITITSCSSSTPSSLAFTEEEVVVTMWSWGGLGYEKLIADFETQNPGITVEIRESGYGQHHDGLLSALDADGELPDIAAVDVAYLPDFWEHRDGLTDLRPYGAEATASQYLDWRWDQGVLPSGQVIGIPTDVGGLALAYRKDLFAAAGLPSEPDDVAPLVATWGDLIELGIQFNENGGEGFIDTSASVFNGRFGQLSGGYVDETGALEITKDSAVGESWDLSIEAIDAGVTAGYRQFSPEWNEAMASGGFAALAAPSWMRGYLASNAPDNAGDWGLVPLPGVAGNWGGSQLVIPARAANPDAAWKLVEFLTTEEAQFSVFSEFGNFPSTPSAYDHPEIDGLTDDFFDGQVVGPIFVDSVESVPVKQLNEGMRAMNNEVIGALFDREVGGVYHATEAEAWDYVLNSFEEIHAG